MQKYVRMHVVEVEPMTLGEWEKATGKNWNERERPRTDAGYKCDYPDGYSGWCPKKAFEEVSRPIDGMTFGMAVEAMKRGEKISRKGWNGKGMWLWLKPAALVKTDWCHDPVLRKICEDHGGEIQAQPYVQMLNAQGEVCCWHPAQSDMFAEDWLIVK